MIKVRDWIASIPDDEKHIAYVGEGKCVKKEFVLCGDGWEDYSYWTFFLDMNFDPESITTRDTRQVVSTRINRSEIDETTGVTADETVFEETYTVHDEDVLGYDLADIAPLTKEVKEDGIHLAWTVLRQHTVLPGKLWATLRAVSGEIDEVKKSAIMVFEVDAAICATPATVPAVSTMEQMLQETSAAKDAAVEAKAFVESAAAGANNAAAEALNCQFACENYAELAQTRYEETKAHARAAAQSADTAGSHAQAAERYADTASSAANAVVSYTGKAETAAQTAADSAQQAEAAAQRAAQCTTLTVKLELVSANSPNGASVMVSKATHSASEIFAHVQGGGDAVLDWGGKCVALASCTQDEAVFSAVETDGDETVATTITVDNDKAYAFSEGALNRGGGTVAYNRVNVRDYGAVGDGVADDRGAIIHAFDAAKSTLPCEVYFPAGTYGISNGITVELPLGSGGLRVSGAGRDVTAIRYLDSYDPDQDGNMWYAIRIWPEGMQKRPQVPPATEEEWLHDISYTGLTVQDPDPCAHAWHTAKGDPSNEETHGVDLVYCKGVSVTECQFITVGDEAIDICYCHDVTVMNNRLVGSPGAGPGGGAISIGDGCQGVVVCGNTVNGSAPDETLADGTVITKSNYGIAVESLFSPVKDVTITGNTIRDVHGKGINLGATNEGAGIYNVVIADNVIDGCDMGIRLSGALPKDNVKISGNLIAHCSENALWTSKAGTLTVCGNVFRAVGGTYAVDTSVYGGDSRPFLADNVFEDIAYGGVCCAGTSVLKDCVFNGLGTAETAPTGNVYGVYKYSGELTVSGCRFKNVRMLTLKSGIHDADEIDNTSVEVVNKTTGGVDGGGASVTGAVNRIVGSALIGRVDLTQDHSILQGTKITYKGSAHAVSVSADGVSVTGCIILADNGSYRAINEASGCNHNLFADNIVNRGIGVTGAQSVAVNNVDTRVTA